MSVRKVKNPRVGHSWTILLGMSAIPVLALMIKIFPGQMAIWYSLMALCGLLVLRSVYGFCFPARSEEDKKDAGIGQAPQH